MTVFRDEPFEKQGFVAGVLPDSCFCVTLDDGSEVLAYVSGQMRRHNVCILIGDRVTLSIAQRDQSRGVITFRHLAGGHAMRNAMAELGAGKDHRFGSVDDLMADQRADESIASETCRG